MSLLAALWSWLFPSRATTPRPHEPAPITTTGTQPGHRPPPTFPEGWGALGVVGESNYQPALQQAAQAGRVCWATLVPEPDNPFDPNAVAVQIRGLQVGYLSRADARRYQRRLRVLAQPMEVPAKLIGGTADKPSLGVLLNCLAVEQLPTPNTARRKSKIDIDTTDQPF